MTFRKKSIRSLLAYCFAFFLLLEISSFSVLASTESDSLTNRSFALLTAVDERYAMDLNENNTINGNKIQTWKLNWTDAQKYYLRKVSNNYYAIIHSASGMAIDVESGIRGSGVKVQLYQYNGTDAQQWKLISLGEGKYYIQSKLGYYLDVQGGNATDGTQIQVYQGNQTKAQQWKILFLDSSDGENITEGMYTFTSALDSGYALDLTSNDSTNGANIELWEVNGTQAQNFNVTRVFDNWYTITHHESGKAVDVTGGRQASGVNVEIWEYNGVAPQLFKFIDAGNGYYYIRNIMGYNIDVTGGDVYNGNNIQVYTPNETKAQQWRISPSSFQYYPAYHGSSGSIVVALNALGIPSTYSFRSDIAKANGISNYSGTANQNIQLLNCLKEGKLVRADSNLKISSYTQENKDSETVASPNSKVESAVQWAIQIANDDSYGYEWGGKGANHSYDCSGLVCAAFQQAGVTKSSVGTSGYLEYYKKSGFSCYPAGSVVLKRGDVLLNPGHHVELYIGDNHCVAAHSNYDKKAGDSSGKEIQVRHKDKCTYCRNVQYKYVLRYDG